MSKLFKACLALAAFAALAVVPATASAVNDPLVTYPAGTKLAVSHALPVGVVGTSVGTTKMWDSAEGGTKLTECATATMTGNLETNTGTGPGTGAVEGNVTSATFSGTPANHAASHCEGSLGNITVNANPATNGLSWCLRSTTAMATDRVQIRGNACTSASRPIRFVLTAHTIFGSVTCTYQRSAAIEGSYTTSPSQTEVSIGTATPRVEFPLLEGSFLCPSKGFLEMSFRLYRDVAEHVKHPLLIDNQ